MRVFKTKPLARWARKENISEETFREAGKEVTEGKFEADLGKNLVKKRISRESEGKSGAFRAIIAFKKPNSDRVIFMHGFAKSEKSNITEKEKHILSTIAQYYIEASDSELKKLLEAGELLEIQEVHNNE